MDSRTAIQDIVNSLARQRSEQELRHLMNDEQLPAETRRLIAAAVGQASGLSDDLVLTGRERATM